MKNKSLVVKFVTSVIIVAVLSTVPQISGVYAAEKTTKTEDKRTDSTKSQDKKESNTEKKTDTKNTEKSDSKKDSNTDTNETAGKQGNTDKTANNQASTNYSRGTYHVSKDGTGDFTTIASAVVIVPSGSTLIIHEGVYNEALNILGKVINMRGVSKENCIIQYDTANYSKVPLNISGGIYDNLTIKGYHKSNDLAAFQGYAIHIDHDSLAGQTVTFNNCNIISENAFCVGIGLRRGARIAFRGCSFVAKKQGVMLFHDSQTPALAGKAYLSLENCSLNNAAQELIVTQCLSPASTTELTFKNNYVKGLGDGGCLAYGSYAGSGSGWMGAQNVFLTKSSAGNNIMSFNYADIAKYQASLTETAKLNAANLMAGSNNLYPNVSPSGKYYTIRTEDGREINVPVENIDNYTTPNTEINASVAGNTLAEQVNNTAVVSDLNIGKTESSVSPSGKYYTIRTEDGIEVNVPVENIDN